MEEIIAIHKGQIICLDRESYDKWYRPSTEVDGYDDNELGRQ